MRLTSLLCIIGFALIGWGNLVGGAAISLLTREALASGSAWVFWSLDNFTPAGQHIVRRGRRIQALGLVLFVLGLLLW
jgi:hypothetical protein